jgi:hypothetical protein
MPRDKVHTLTATTNAFFSCKSKLEFNYHSLMRLCNDKKIAPDISREASVRTLLEVGPADVGEKVVSNKGTNGGEVVWTVGTSVGVAL